MLEPLPEKTIDSLDLYPHQLLTHILWRGGAREPVEFALDKYDDLIDMACEAVGFYVHHREDRIVGHCLELYDHIDQFFDLSDRKNIVYYLFPVLGYIIKKSMDRLSSSEYNLNTF
jgi:hypothetical protein